MSGYDHLFYDVNNVIYSLVAKSRTEEQFYLKLYKEIDALVKVVRPRQTLFMAVDGPGPRAKVATQLSRRRKGEYLPDQPVQRMAFTPGTSFMHRLVQSLFVFGASRSTTARNRGLSIWVSGSDCAGEGESKCFAHMKRYPSHHKCLVIGNDSDLIAYALRAECEVHILRNTNRSHQLIDVSKVKVGLLRGIAFSPEQERRVLDDFLIMSLMCGNDYIPSLAFFDFPAMWNAYRRLKTVNLAENESVFLFDARTKRVDWDFCEQVFLNAGKDFDSAVDDGEGPGHGRLHPRSVVTEIMALAGETMLVESIEGTTNVKMFSASFPSKLSFIGRGRSLRESTLRACLDALAPESPLFGHLSRNAKFDDEALTERVVKLLSAFHHQADDVSAWFQKRKLLPVDHKIVVGTFKGLPFLPPPPKATYSKDDVYKRYLEGLVWSFELYGGQVKNYGYHYPYFDRIPLQSLCKAAPQLGDKWDLETAATPPLSPVALGLCLLPGQARQLLPEPFASMELEKDPTVGHIFKSNNEALVTDPERLSHYLNAVETFVSATGAEQALSDSAKHLMSLHLPTAFMDRGNPLLKTFTPTELAKFTYKPPKLPTGGVPFNVLADAPNSHRTVAAVNLTRQVNGNWFHFPGPHMQTRKFSTYRSLARVFFRK